MADLETIVKLSQEDSISFLTQLQASGALRSKAPESVDLNLRVSDGTNKSVNLSRAAPFNPHPPASHREHETVEQPEVVSNFASALMPQTQPVPTCNSFLALVGLTQDEDQLPELAAMKKAEQRKEKTDAKSLPKGKKPLVGESQVRY